MRKDFALACECELRVNVYLSNSCGLVVFTGFTSGRGGEIPQKSKVLNVRGDKRYT